MCQTVPEGIGEVIHAAGLDRPEAPADPGYMERPAEPAAAIEERPHTPYCLACYAPMARERGASQRCERCGFVNVR